MMLGRRWRLPWAVVVASVLVTPVITAQSQTADAPALKVGDSWTWQWRNVPRQGNTSRGGAGQTIRTVVRLDQFAGKDAYVVSRPDGTFVAWNFDLQPLGVLDSAGVVKFRQGRTGDDFFPLSVGKGITRHIDNPEGRWRGDYKFTVTTVEEVSTVAGQFTAFSVRYQGAGANYDGSAFTETGTQWYAPAAKQWVKTVFSVSGANTGRDYTEELASYHLVLQRDFRLTAVSVGDAHDAIGKRRN